MSLVVRVVAPTGRDGELITGVLKENGLASEVCTDFPALLASLGEEPIGPLLIAEEALNPDLIDQLGAFIHNQPPWSDMPVLVLTHSGRETKDSRRLERERLPLGAPVLLERPIRTATLLSSVRAALRARQRQYQIRETLRERNTALAALKQQRETLQVVLDNLPVGVLMAEASGQIVMGNRNVEEIFRHPILLSPDVESHGDWVAFHPDGRRVKGVEYPLARAMRTGRSIPAEPFLYQRGDGTLAWVRIAAAPIFSEAGVVTGGVVAISDIDQERQAADALKRSEERARRLIENSSIGLAIGDLAGGISYLNPTCLHLLGYTADEVSAGEVRWDAITPPEYSEADRRALAQLRATGTAEPYQKEYLARDGRRIPVLLGATMIPSQAGDSTEEVAVFVTDLSVQKRAEAALVQSEKLAAVGRLAASISHEINNPLEAVTNLIYLASTSHNLAEIQRHLGSADSELARVAQIVAQTLRFHRQSTRPRAVTPDELLEPTLALYSGRLSNCHVDLAFEKRNARPVTCYEGDIRQVLNNLIGNAIDAMRSGGRLRVRSGNARLWKTGVRGIRITIADTGHGIPPPTLKRIFEPFYTTKGINGTGLGLWISHGIVEKHHGRLQVRSSTRAGASGTVFRLFLSALPPESKTEGAQGKSRPTVSPIYIDGSSPSH